jgi:hypothetical protein
MTPAPPKRTRFSGAQALESLATSVNQIVSSSLFDAPASGPHPDTAPATPRKDKAFNTICDEEGLSPHSIALSRKVFRGSAELAHEYLSFNMSQAGMREARSYWLTDELTRVRGI